MIDRLQIRWLFFDVGDTLLDEAVSMRDWCRQVAESRTRHGQATTAQQVWDARQRAYSDFAPEILKRIAETLPPLDDYTGAYSEANYNHSLEQPFPGAGDVLRSLAKRFKLGVIANQARGTAQRLCDHGWAGIFSICVSSTEADVRKPDPAIFRLALEQARCTPEQAVMIGDRIDNDILPAKALGIGTVRILQGMSTLQRPRGPQDEADHTVESLAALPNLLL
jgi:HAD superfamily hydrolase (TIGR01549 family)